MGEQLYSQLEDAEEAIVQAELEQKERIRLEIRIQDIEERLESHTCPSCKQTIANRNESEMRNELAGLKNHSLAVGIGDLEEQRHRRDKLRKFATAPSALTWFHDQERDLRRERLRNEKREQRVRQISEELSDTTVEIDSLERNLAEHKSTKAKVESNLELLESRRSALKQEVHGLGTKIASQPEVDPLERRLQRTATDASDVVERSFDVFRKAMRARVELAASALFRQLTTEKEYSGVSISPDYLLSVTDQQNRPLRMISAGANQILTMAFIGALAECSVEDAPMVMDTPFGRLDVGHRSSILEWVGTLDRQVILFVQSGEYDPTKDAELLNGKIGREFTIDRITPNRSEVRQG